MGGAGHSGAEPPPSLLCASPMAAYRGTSSAQSPQGHVSLLVSFLTSQNIPSPPSVLKWNFLCKQLLWGRAICMTGSCALDKGSVGQVAAPWVCRGQAGEPGLAAGSDSWWVQKGASAVAERTSLCWERQGLHVWPVQAPSGSFAICRVTRVLV